MKKMKFLTVIAACLTIVSLNACKESNTEKVADTPTKDGVSAEKLAQIKALGFSTNGVVKTANGYLVEGDLLLTEENLLEIPAGTNLNIAETEQYRTTNIVKGLPRVITISLTNLPQKFSDAADAMISRYNSLGLRLTFQRAAAGNKGNIDLFGFSEPAKNGLVTLGIGSFPTATGQPGSQIKMNTHADAYGSRTTAFITSVIQHEVGHCIGFRHTDYFNRDFSCPYDAKTNNEGQSNDGAIKIPGTPSTEDAGSFMLACAGSGTGNFNANDIIALNYLYK